MRNTSTNTDEHPRRILLSQIRATWLAPLCALILISSISIASYVAQTYSAQKTSDTKNEKTRVEAQHAITSAFEDLQKVGIHSAAMYDSDNGIFEASVTQYADNIDLGSSIKSAALVGFIEPSTSSDPDDTTIAFVQAVHNATQEPKIASIAGLPVSQLTDISHNIEQARTTGLFSLSAPFVSNSLLESQSTYVMMVFPVYSGLGENPTIAQRKQAFRGSIIIPVALNLLLEDAQADSPHFHIFRFIDNDHNVIATSNDKIDLTDFALAKTPLTIQGHTFQFEYDNYSNDVPELAAARRSTLFAGLGLGIIVFLLFAMMRVSEKRSRRLAEHAEREVYESEARFSALIEQSSDITLVLDSLGIITFASPSIWSKLGYSHEEIVGKRIIDIVGLPTTQKTAVTIFRKLNNGEVIEPFVADVMTKDGHVLTFECVINDLRDDEAVNGIVCNSRDISERKQAEAQVVKAKALYENALSNAPIGVALVHQDGECFFSNDALREFLGRTEEEVTEFRLRDFISPDDQFAFSDMWQSLELRGTDRTTKELRFDHPDGRQRWGNISAQGVYDDDIFQYYVVQIEDTTERRSIAERLEYQAIHDPLTGLPNRLLFVDRLEVSLLRAKRTGLAVAVLFLDLDRFKVVNDSLGHAAGDRLLETVSERIKASVRPNDTLARFGGDEFVILCEDITDERQTQEISERLLENINRPIMLLEGEVYVTASIGIARSLDGEDTPETILRDADTAMYRAKDGGRNRAEVFDERTHARAVANLETGNGMFRALSENEFRVHYQPVISLSSGRLSGFEALVYWDHPERGHVGPVEFIPLAEETGVIVPLGLRIFEEACAALHRWHNFSAQASHLTMSINLSPRQLAEPTFVDEVQKILKKTEVNPARIWFEITETALMVDADSTIAMLDQLCNLGVHFEVDDFGTGFSSLSYLKKFPVDALKIDQGFVDGLGRDPEDSAIVTAVVSLSHALGLQAIAEGVETPLQMAELKTLGCEYAQGYLFARAAHADQWDDAVRSDELFTFAEQPAD